MLNAPVAKFVCPHCGEMVVSRVLETRDDRRRRECAECGGTFVTVEVVTTMRHEPTRHHEQEPYLPFA